MSAQAFSIGEAIRLGWNTTFRRLWSIVVLLIVIIATPGVVAVVAGVLAALAAMGKLTVLTATLSAVLALATIVLGFIVGLGTIRVFLLLADDQPASVGNLFDRVRLVWNYFLSTILFQIIVYIGLILLIVPGIILAIRLQFYALNIVDRELGPIEALKQSFAQTRGATWKLFLFGLLAMLINWVGSIVLLVGLFVSIPTTMIAWAHIYRRLQAAQGDVVAESADVEPGTVSP